MGPNVRTTEERLADTFQPVIPYAFSIVFGPGAGRLFAYVFGERPTQSMVKLCQGLEELFEIRDLSAFLSPTYRRWARNELRIILKSSYQQEDLPRLMRKMMCQTWDGWKEVLKEIDPSFPPFKDLEKQLEARLEARDFSRIQKYSEIEAQADEKAKETMSNSKEWAEVFPPVPPIVDLRLRRRLLKEVNGYDGYTWEVATIVAEVQINRRSLAGELTHRQASSLLSHFSHLSAKELKGATLSQSPHLLSDMLVGLLKLLMDEQKTRDFMGRIVGNVLINRFLDQPYSKKKKVSLDKPVADGLILGDTIPCDRADEQSSLLEDSMFLRQYLPEHLPPSEWEASDLVLRAEERELTVEELCEEEGKNYKTVQRNFERAIKRLKSHCTKP